MLLLRCLLACLPLLPLTSAWGGDHANGGLPQVDLGYEIHQAISYNETGQTYNFTNIRYAQPPVGDLRFAAPVPPTGRDTQVQDGSQPRICPQATPAWFYVSALYAPYLLAGNETTFNYTQAQEQLQAFLESGGAETPPAPGITEDCLFLDVIVPKAVFDSARNRHRRTAGGGAPVLVWIYGGGYTLGTKGGTYNPSGLIKASQNDGNPGVIYVAMNYRLGAMGWLSGPSLQAAGGVSNAGLYDQRLALEWVQKNIHLFGGDPNQVTVMGESAGGGSVQHQLTAYGGQRGAPFQRAIPQSPGFVPIQSYYFQETTAQAFLSLLNVSTIEEARQLDSAAVIRANTVQVGLAPYSSFIYNPVADGIFAPQTPGQLLNSGQYVKDIDIMVGHNVNEGDSFAPPFTRNQQETAAWVRTNYPGAAQPALEYLLEVAYPPIYDGSQGYTNPLRRTIKIVTESAFTCNTNYINKAYGNNTYAYEYQVPPALHGFDVPYTFYNGQGTDEAAGLFAPIAELHQAYLTNFVKYGNPNGPGVPYFPVQGMNASMNGINVTGAMTETDPTVNERCAWLQKALLL